MSEEIKNGKVVSFSYTLRDEDGNVVEQSEPGRPLEYLHGNHNIIPGLENQLTGMKQGDTKVVKVEPKEGYGEYDNNLLFKVPKANFPQEVELYPGMEFQTDTDEGVMIVTIKEIDGDTVIVDANHPMAGQALNFDVKIESVRDATDQEKAHGHVHAHGHDH